MYLISMQKLEHFLINVMTFILALKNDNHFT